MSKKIIKGLSLTLLTFLLFCTVISGTYSCVIPDNMSCMKSAELAEYPFLSCVSESNGTAGDQYNVSYKLFGMLPLKSVKVSVPP